MAKLKSIFFIVSNKWFKCINVLSCSDPPHPPPHVETMWKRFKVVKNTKVLGVFYYNHGEYNILRKRVVQWVKALQNHKVKNSKNWYWLGHWITNLEVLGSKSQDGSKVNSAFYPLWFKIKCLSRPPWDFLVKSKLAPHVALQPWSSWTLSVKRSHVLLLLFIFCLLPF